MHMALITSLQSTRHSILIVMLLVLSMFCAMTPNENASEHNELSIPQHWTEWTLGRSSEGIHADAMEKIIVLLAKTSDVSPHSSHDVSYFQELLFGSQPGSMAHFYSENSRGQTQIEGEVIGWLQLSNKLSDYDEDLWKGEEFGVGEGIEEAITLADSSVDFSKYDQNNDDIIDNLMVIFVGESDSANGDGDEDGEPNDFDAIWPIQWSLQTDFMTSDGVAASNFFVCTEFCKIGTFAHEFGHNLGLPDLYDTDYSSEGVGFWSIMSGGNYLEYGGESNPAHFDAWSKYKLGWVTPIVIEPDTISRQIVLDPVEISGDIIKIPISNLEYWLIEYRSIDAGHYDKGLPKSGVLIWHIDESVFDENGDFDNSNEEHPAVKLIQSDGNDDLSNAWNDGDAGDLYVENDVFNIRSIPSATTWSGDDVGLSLHIREIDQIMDTATISFSGDDLIDAWFYDIYWQWSDSEGDGFMNEVVFSYDIDTDSSSTEVRVEFEMFDAETHEYRGSFDTVHSIMGDEIDDFEYSIGLYDEDEQELLEIKVILWLGNSIVDAYTPEHPIWLEYPAIPNKYDEWFDTLQLEFFDTNQDGDDETIRAEYEVASYDPASPNVEVWLEAFNQNDFEERALVWQEDVESNIDSLRTIEIDLTQFSIRPGLIDIWVYLWVDNKLEEIFAWQSSEFWWNAIYIEKSEVQPFDLDGNGDDDSVYLEFQFDNSWRDSEPMFLQFFMWNASDFDEIDKNPIDRAYTTIFLGPKTHSSSGGREPIEFIFTSMYTSNIVIELRTTTPDGETISYIFPDAGEIYLRSFDSDGDGVGDLYDVFPNDSSESIDSDSDGIGDNSDVFPFDKNESLDSDGDGVGDNSDVFPFDINESMDSDGDGVGDNNDAFPFDSDEILDSDGNGIGDNAQQMLEENATNDTTNTSDISMKFVFIFFIIGFIGIGGVLFFQRNGQRDDMTNKKFEIMSNELDQMTSATCDSTTQHSTLEVESGTVNVEIQWTDENGYTWRKMSDESVVWWNGRDWIKY